VVKKKKGIWKNCRWEENIVWEEKEEDGRTRRVSTVTRAEREA